MRKILPTLFLILIAAGSTSCGNKAVEEATPLERAEMSLGSGRPAAAQRIADSIMLSEAPRAMNIDQLCRLSLLYMHLCDYSSEEEPNIAMAAHALTAAFERDSDSTAMVIRNVANDDRARMAIVLGLTEARRNPQDSVLIFNDSIPDYGE